VPEQIELVILVFLVVAGGTVVSWLWQRGWELGTLLPPQRSRAVPWGFGEVLFAALSSIALLVLVQMFLGLVLQFGLLDWLYGKEFAKLVLEGKGEEAKLAGARLMLWRQVIAVPLQVAAVLIVFRAVSDTRPYQLGLTPHRLCPNTALGVMAWLAVTGAILVLSIAVQLFYEWALKAPDQHPFEQLTASGIAWWEWCLLGVSAVVAAPITEELFFRGIVQPYLSRRWWGGQAGLVGALVFAILSRGASLQSALQDHDWRAAAWELQPVLFVLGLAGVFEALRLRYRPEASAIFGSAALFALAHAFAWPTPVPLFVLGLVLGWLAYRTQGLVAPIVLHSLFNSVAVVVLLLTAPQREKGKELTTPERRPPSTSTSTFVPGSWWPRRM